MPTCILDTNVLLTADGKSEASDDCVRTSKSRLNEIKQNGVLVLDKDFLILKEYGLKLSPLGPNTPGNAFLKWALQNRATPRCHQIQLTPLGEHEFESFPHSDPILDKFDPPDRKFVALSLAHPAKPPIIVAGDRGWHRHEAALLLHGVKVEFLCADDTTYSRK